MTAALEERLVVVKKEKLDAEEAANDHLETTQDTALYLDKFQSYADALKMQVRQQGGVPQAWEDSQRHGAKA